MNRQVTRRNFIAGAALAAAATGVARAQEQPARNAIPRWRGFNLLEFFQAYRDQTSSGMVSEDDLRWIRDWGFDFVRLPMDYWMWIDSDWRVTKKLEPEDVTKIDERVLEKVDRTVELCRNYGLHLSLNFHRAPGYCINQPEREPFVLWSDFRAEDAFVYHWEVFAKRYRGISPKDLSFNLVNEAPAPRDGYMRREDYVRVMTMATEKIREITPGRPIIIDGLNVGNRVVDEMIPAGVAQSVHAYTPSGISHFRASWVDRKMDFPEPSWPLPKKDGSQWDRAALEEHYRPWGEIVRRGVGVHCGEAGCYNKTPHGIFLAWLSDVMEILKSHDIGWALWNFRGSFGVLDSGREDIAYEDWYGHKLDRTLLDLLVRS